MTKRILMLFVVVAIVFVFAACGQAAKTTAATTTAATTTAATTTAATTEATTVTTVPVVVPEAYVDIDFGADAITDKKGNASFQKVGTPIVTTKTVTHNGVSKEVSALSIASAGNFVVGTFDKIETIDAMNEMLAAGFSIEAFYLDNSSDPSAVFCMTEKPNGFGIAHQKNKYASQNNKPYFITGNGDTANAWNAVYPTETISDTELVHVVAVYNPTAKTHTIYINGKLSNTTANVPCVKAATTTSSVHTGETPMFNTFGLGGDLSPTATKNDNNYIGDFLATDMTIVDAKFYTCVLTAEQVAEAYKTATASFVAAE